MQQDLAEHLCREHGWPSLPYYHRPQVNEQHDMEHRWGVPPPRSVAEVYDREGRPQAPTVWD